MHRFVQNIKEKKVEPLMLNKKTREDEVKYSSNGYSHLSVYAHAYTYICWFGIKNKFHFTDEVA